MSYFAAASIAIVVEAIIEYAKSIVKMFENEDKKAGITQLCAICVSVLLCLASNANLFDYVGVTFFAPFIGTVMTGILCSRGANFVSDIIGKINNK